MKKIVLPCLFIGLGFLFAVILLPKIQLGYWVDNPLFISKLSFANASTYIGDVDDEGVMNGNGRLEWKDGTYYEGGFVDGVFEGAGKLVYLDGAIYEGEFKNGLFNGQGVFSYSNGDIYEGEFVDDRMEGKGKWIIKDKHTYIGDIKNDGKMHGKGKITYENGNTYTGEFINNLMHGQGIYKSSDGKVYSGEFFEGKFEGKGKYTKKSYGKYVGEFQGWYANGEGIRTDTEGNQWKGNFVDSELDEEGEYIGINGTYYKGGFLEGRYHGKGELIDEDGNKYIGEFSYGFKHGKGEYEYAEELDGIKKFSGEWNYGEVKEGDENFVVYSGTEIAEYALYNQAKSLEAAYSKVKKSVDGKPELYLLGVSGWGKQDVFYREMNYLNNLFSRLFDTSNRSIFLVNSKRNYRDNPLATVESIRNSIVHLARKMNKNEDILFFYATSHGDKEKGFSLSSRGLSLSDITPEILKEILVESGIKYSVVVISSCYSGTFAEKISDENTLIVTAASSDKKSFGCSDERLFTYFGKAFLEQSVEQKDTFKSAFENAIELVTQWEKEEGFTPSDPVIKSGAGIEKQLGKWRNTLVIK